MIKIRVMGSARGMVLPLVAMLVSLAVTRRALADDAACAALSARPNEAVTWLTLGEALAAGRHLSCRGALQKRFLGHEEPLAPDSPPDTRLVSGAAREALALTWTSAQRTRALKLLVDATRPTLTHCTPKQVKDGITCPIPEGDPKAWWSFRALLLTETGDPPDGPSFSAASAAGRELGWTAPGTASSEGCSPLGSRRPAVEPPSTDPSTTCGVHGYRICPVREKATWVEVAYTPCEGDKLEKTAYVDENKDGVDDALLWIRYSTYDGEEVSGKRTYLDIVDGRSGRILLHGLVAASQITSEGARSFALTVQRPSAGRLRLEPPASPSAAEGPIRHANPEFLAPGTYTLGPNGFRRTSSE